MASDAKRIPAPESIPYHLTARQKTKTYQEKLAIVLQNGQRQDKRKFEDARKIFLKLNVISKAKGSAYIEMGNTKVIVSVFDPREVPNKQNNFNTNGELHCEFRYSPFATKRRAIKNDVVEKSMALSLKRALLPAVCRYAFTNFQVDIHVNVIEDDGSVLAAAITASGLALSDAGIPMYDIITATSVAIVDNQVLVDPTKEEEELCTSVDLYQEHGLIVMASLHTLEQVSELWSCGLMISDTVSRLTDLLREHNKQIVPIIQQILVNKVKNSIDESDQQKTLKTSKSKSKATP